VMHGPTCPVWCAAQVPRFIVPVQHLCCLSSAGSDATRYANKIKDPEPWSRIPVFDAPDSTFIAYPRALHVRVKAGPRHVSHDVTLPVDKDVKLP
jgi:hypothetical protein